MFYGTKTTNFMCSKCFKDSQGSSPGVTEKDSKMEAQSEEKAVEEEKKEEKPIQTKKNRCWNCNKKVGLLGFTCKCGYIFCSKHRHADDHECDYDHMADDREALRKNNPMLVTSKLETS
eukprot:CAMPEP_0197004394 /NCGR_PEP_ID=MMETSP1380-20130617/22122_1 /TAXON_ID=5936 /ORGANISM="Euplotes crassus, Strain CT5" /LENGTH=118 /DNA_ID=CAMNT_0042423163 /DNA_START=97 /DNA_END=453 /DNA_ORIENTATION=+